MIHRQANAHEKGSENAIFELELRRLSPEQQVAVLKDQLLHSETLRATAKKHSLDLEQKLKQINSKASTAGLVTHKQVFDLHEQMETLRKQLSSQENEFAAKLARVVSNYEAQLAALRSEHFTELAQKANWSKTEQTVRRQLSDTASHLKDALESLALAAAEKVQVVREVAVANQTISDQQAEVSELRLTVEQLEFRLEQEKESRLELSQGLIESGNREERLRAELKMRTVQLEELNRAPHSAQQAPALDRQVRSQVSPIARSEGSSSVEEAGAETPVELELEAEEAEEAEEGEEAEEAEEGEEGEEDEVGEEDELIKVGCNMQIAEAGQGKWRSMMFRELWLRLVDGLLCSQANRILFELLFEFRRTALRALAEKQSWINAAFSEVEAPERSPPGPFCAPLWPCERTAVFGLPLRSLTCCDDLWRRFNRRRLFFGAPHSMGQR
jgi:hypothetical protein